ncbi:hypothetical protein HCN44_002062 [Aphidius gifuensis]|uniref:RRM domain-containing protein n=1 Tax=Aphidius gifuensis TaxID=684658 RepID=A0A834Y1Y0_APHGI|nr:GATA zinc finger domain-containing protein 14-like [Aphidius gifuensis]KAF7996430.1 hypothetical protein HCN44_002062 [Aphidius gifuensis]
MSSASTGGTEGSSPASSPASAASQAMAAPKYGTLVPNRIFVGGISASTSEAELAQLFSTYGNVKATKIILDRAGVSKGYGFVTFETEEEAKRLQQESECIVLRERKLNIAPAIKKQPFNRSFDGGAGSPPAVPTNPYFYTNGMSLPYQNGLTFYNAGGPTPGTTLAPPGDPAALYQAAGVFGPQSASAHQTYAPMMYPCPAPSLYMPQQYQYSPMPYDTYYAGAASQPQYLYSPGNGTSNGNPNSTTTTSGTDATSPLSTHHYFTTSGLPTAPAAHHNHHQSNVPSGGGVSSSSSSSPQVEQLYYNFSSIGQHQQATSQPSSLLTDHHQPLFLYTNDCQQNTEQKNQEETCSTSSHSQSDQTGHQQQQHQITQSTGNETTHNTTTQSTSITTTTTTTSTPATTTTALPALMPLKYQNPYTNYPHPINIQSSQPQYCYADIEESNPIQILYHPVYIQNNSNAGSPSLLPTPTSPYDLQRLQSFHHHQNTPPKLIPYPNSHIQNGYAIFTPPPPSLPQMHHSQTQYNKYQTPKSHHHSNKNYSPNNNTNNRKSINTSSCFLTPHKSGGSQTTNKQSNIEHNNNNARKNLNSDFSNRKNHNLNTKLTTKDNNKINYNNDCKLTSPPPAPYSPMIHPLPNYFPTNIQVQYQNGQSRYHGMANQQTRKYTSLPIDSQMYLSSRKQVDKYGNTMSNQGLVIRSNKQKINGLMQSTQKNNIDDDKGVSGGSGSGGGSNPSQSVMTRMPLTPPGTPRNLQDNQINVNCHQLQALSL